VRAIRLAGRFLLAALLFLLRPILRRAHRRAEPRDPNAPPPERVHAGETAALVLFALTALAAGAFVAAYALDASNELLGFTIGVAIGSLGVAAIVIAKLLVPEEEHVQELAETEHAQEREEVAGIVAEVGVRLTRRRLVIAAGGGAVAATGAALLVPAASLGPFLDTGRLRDTPWRRGVRLVDEHGRPLLAADLEVGAFATAFPEGASPRPLDASLIVVRLALDELRLPPARRSWAPGGILAYSRSCTHAGCAISLFDYPTYRPTSPRARLVCPCHYSAFDAGGGGGVLAGPAGRSLPQLPLAIDRAGVLRAAGGLSGPPGPSWSGVRS
jgi:ubiquinol-cytochrome c reductase iron-sulfur subunit